MIGSLAYVSTCSTLSSMRGRGGQIEPSKSGRLTRPWWDCEMDRLVSILCWGKPHHHVKRNPLGTRTFISTTLPVIDIVTGCSIFYLLEIVFLHANRR
jgi:hypothetical protein